jgi:hypothetical protein
VQQFKTTLTNALTSAGEVILPVATKVLAWVNGFANALKNNAALRTALEITLGAGFAAALASKLKNAFDTVKGLFGAAPLVSNTTATEQNTAAILDMIPALRGMGALGAGEGAAVGAGEGAALGAGEGAAAVAGGTAATVGAIVAAPLAVVGAAALIVNAQKLDTAGGQAALVKKFGAKKAQEINAYAKEHNDWDTATIDRFGQVEGGKRYYGRAGGMATALMEQKFRAGLTKITNSGIIKIKVN